MRVVVMSALAVMATAGGASAATIKAGGPSVGTQVALDPADFVGSGPCGYGNSVVGDGCSVVLKTDRNAPDAYGRFDPNGLTWIDSQDLRSVSWTLSHAKAFSSLTIALTDAFDQGCSRVLGCSSFSLASAGATWSIDTRRENGEIDWLTIAFDAPVTTATVEFSTRLNDGWGIVAAVVDDSPVEPPAPVPLPASGLLLAFGLLGLASAFSMRR